nr:hypothetical protein [uncultured Nostoc sp.]
MTLITFATKITTSLPVQQFIMPLTTTGVKDFGSTLGLKLQHFYSFVPHPCVSSESRASQKLMGCDDGYHKFELVSCMILSQGLEE